MYDLIKDLTNVKKLIKIRLFEEKLLELFSEGKINGTTHTCIGQEEIAVAVMSLTKENDYIFSNHRGHGHYLAKFEDYKGLFCEIMGKSGAVNNGVGGSQHINRHNYYSTGIQGESVPVSAGVALSLKKNNSDISISFIGDGTWGEGAVYESLNMSSLWQLPTVVICENNQISQSTPSKKNLSGTIQKRANAFNIDYVEIPEDLKVNGIVEILYPLFDKVRTNRSPLIVEVKTKRISSHSKGDDTRDQKVISELKSRDWYEILNQNKNFKSIVNEIRFEINDLVDEINNSEFSKSKYVYKNIDFLNQMKNDTDNIENQKVLDNLNKAMLDIMNFDNDTYIIGEDIEDPYGGAFKVTKGIHSKFPERVISTPISELGLAGLANGVSLTGKRSIVEFMFADFTFLAFDQIINFAAKTVSMYGYNKSHKIIFRCPYGGHRGYGPTHSQSIHKYLMGVPNLNLFEISPLHSLDKLLFPVIDSGIPSVLFESKVLYPKKMIPVGAFDVYNHKKINNITSVLYIDEHVDAVLITGGGYVYDCIDVVKDLFINYELSVHIINPFQIYPFDLSIVDDYISSSENKIIIVDEGTPGASWSSEIISKLSMKYSGKNIMYNEIMSNDEIIPSSKHLESKMLLNKDKIYKSILKMFNYE
jgi:2-oxoisovalerate dehydrogenase E1 component